MHARPMHWCMCMCMCMYRYEVDLQLALLRLLELLGLVSDINIHPPQTFVDERMRQRQEGGTVALLALLQYVAMLALLGSGWWAPGLLRWSRHWLGNPGATWHPHHARCDHDLGPTFKLDAISSSYCPVAATPPSLLPWCSMWRHVPWPSEAATNRHSRTKAV